MNAEQRTARIAKNFEPIEREARRFTPKHKRIAVRIAKSIGNEPVAYLFGVCYQTVSRWRHESHRLSTYTTGPGAPEAGFD